MCGLAGVVRFDRPGEASRAEARAIRARLVHRGPDGQGDVALGHVALAHARLAMIDRAGGAQPLGDGRYTIVYTGELYNDAELRTRLPGPWRGRADTETVLAAWRAWGPACVDELDGMYAFFVWDDRDQVGHAVRDRLGVKPFAYAALPDGGLAFASEAQALAAVLPRMRADREAIVEYLVAPAFSGVSRSPFAGVRYLAPGHVMRVDRDGVSTRAYWRWTPRADDAVTAEELGAALGDAVARASRADVALGVFLSGGLDSTALAALAPTANPAFALRFPEQAWGTSRIVVSDDLPFARLAAAELGKELVEVGVDRAGLAAELRAIARVDDALPAWEQELGQRALARAAATRVKGVLVGDAADELHYGYHFLLDAAAPRELVARLGAVPIARAIDPDPIARLDAEYRALARPEDTTPVLAITRLVVERWLPRLLHDGDIHTMAFGLEARVPFAARGLLELAQRIAPSRGRDKAMLREALRGKLPEAIRTRVKSALPKDQEVAAIYRAELAAILRDPHPLVRELVDVDALPPDDGEVARAIRFRVIGLHHWAIAHEVAA